MFSHQMLISVRVYRSVIRITCCEIFELFKQLVAPLNTPFNAHSSRSLQVTSRKFAS